MCGRHILRQRLERTFCDGGAIRRPHGTILEFNTCAQNIDIPLAVYGLQLAQHCHNFIAFAEVYGLRLVIEKYQGRDEQQRNNGNHQVT